jgi:hypothetical protein
MSIIQRRERDVPQSKMLFVELSNGGRIEARRDIRAFAKELRSARGRDSFIEFNQELLNPAHIVRYGLAPENF